MPITTPLNFDFNFTMEHGTVELVPTHANFFFKHEVGPFITSVGAEEFETNSTDSDIVLDPLLPDVPVKVIIVGCYGWPQRFQRFFVIPESWVEVKTKLVRAMKEFFAKEHPQPAENLKPGYTYTVFFKGIWNRVYLLSRVDSVKAKLIFYDEGIIRKMYVDRIKLIPEQFLGVPPLVVEVKFVQQPPVIFKGDLVTLDFRYLVRQNIWMVQFIAGPFIMNNAVDLIVSDWIMKAGVFFPFMERIKVSCMATLEMNVDDYQLPPPGSPFPVVAVRESLGHIIVTPVAWLNELANMTKCLPGISLFCKKFPNHHLYPGSSCLVPYAGGWFRARIRSIDRSAAVFAVKVRLVDLGIILYIDRFQARVLPRKLLPSHKPPLCFAVKKTPEMVACLASSEFCLISLNYKAADDHSWVALAHPVPPFIG